MGVKVDLENLVAEIKLSVSRFEGERNQGDRQQGHDELVSLETILPVLNRIQGQATNSLENILVEIELSGNQTVQIQIRNQRVYQSIPEISTVNNIAHHAHHQNIRRKAQVNKMRSRYQRNARSDSIRAVLKRKIHQRKVFSNKKQEKYNFGQNYFQQPYQQTKHQGYFTKVKNFFTAKLNFF